MIQEVSGKDITLVNPAQEAAYTIEEVLKKRDELSDGKRAPVYEFYVSDHTTQFEKMAKEFLNTEMNNVQKIDIESFS